MDFDELEKYVQRKLLESGRVVEWACNPADADGVAARIIHNTWRQTMSGDEFAWKYCDELIARAIKFPPEPIDKKHFSLKDYPGPDP